MQTLDLKLAPDQTGFIALPAGNVTPRETTAETLARVLAPRATQGRAITRTQHYAVGERTHRAHGVRFTYEDGTQQDFPPHARA